jgi:hypothetical protein
MFFQFSLCDEYGNKDYPIPETLLQYVIHQKVSFFLAVSRELSNFDVLPVYTTLHAGVIRTALNSFVSISFLSPVFLPICIIGLGCVITDIEANVHPKKDL